MMAEDWKQQAQNILTTLYLNDGKTQWHLFNITKNSESLTTMLCQVLSTLPSSEEFEIIKEKFKNEQKKKAGKIFKSLLKVERDDGPSEIQVGFAFIIRYQRNKKSENEKLCEPVFSVRGSAENDKMHFVDIEGCIYKSWEEWKKANCDPKVNIAYPKYGYFTCCSDGTFEFDSQKEPIIEFWDWKEAASNILKSYYLSFRETHWHSFDIETELELLKVKLCFPLFGPPTNEKAETIEEAYSDEMKEKAHKIIKILAEAKKNDKSSEISVGFAFVVGYELNKSVEHKEFCQPVFSVLVRAEKETSEIQFVDLHGRIYKSWNDWKKNNNLPKATIAYPKHGYFTCCSDGTFEFNNQKEPIIEFGESPQCSSWSTTKNVGDVAATVTSLGCAFASIISLATPLAPIVLTASAVTGVISATYGAARGIGALVDKGTHGQSLSDRESLTLWFSVAATPLHFASSAVTGLLARGAVQQGRIFTQGIRFAASALLCTTFGFDAVLVSLSVINLIQKAKDKQLTRLDVLQFSIGLFFFSNTLMQPKTATSVIRNAQSAHFEKFANSMTDDAAKQTFVDFLENNKIDGSIRDRSNVVRAINRINDPNNFFKVAAADPSAWSIKIGGRKGRTFILTSKHGFSMRVKPNDYQPAALSTALPLTSAQQLKISNNLQKEVERNVKSCFGENQDLFDIKLNGEKIFEKLDNYQKRNVSRTLGETAKHDRDVTGKAFTIAEKMGCKTCDEYLSIVEMVAKKVEGSSKADKRSALNFDVNTFVKDLQSDLASAERIASKGGLTFKDPYKAVYHYRKHREEFPSYIKKYGDTMEVYLGQVKNDVFDPSNLRRTHKFEDGSIKYIYATNNDEFGVLISKPGQTDVSTIFKKPGCSDQFPKQTSPITPTHPVDAPRLGVPEVASQVASTLGLPTFQVIVTVNDEVPLSESEDLTEDHNAAIAELLATFNETL